MQRRYGTIVVALVVLILVMWGVSALVESTEGTKKDAYQQSLQMTPQEKEIELWREKIRTEGGDVAFQELLKSVASSTDSEQHRLGHVFGSALYLEKGIDGFTMCDNSLNGGCQHEFIGRAIQERGIGSIIELSDMCLKKFGMGILVGCQHGVGHGLVSYFGYSTSDLSKGLKECDTLEATNQTRGCYGGAFMEFNLRIMANNKVRDFTPESPFALCDTVAKPYKGACYFWSAQWMLSALYPSDHSVTAFKGVGIYCEQTPYTSFRKACFEGLGYFAAPFANFESAATHTLCDASSASPEYQKVCWDYASEAVK